MAPGASLKGYNYLEAQTAANWISTYGGESYSSDIDIFNNSFGSYNRSFGVAASVIQTTFLTTLPSMRSGKGAIFVKSSGNSFSDDADFYSGSSVCGDSANLGLSCNDANLDVQHIYPIVVVVGDIGADGK